MNLALPAIEAILMVIINTVTAFPMDATRPTAQMRILRVILGPRAATVNPVRAAAILSTLALVLQTLLALVKQAVEPSLEVSGRLVILLLSTIASEVCTQL